VTFTLLALSALALFAGGAVKGTSGVGIPLVSLTLLSLFLPLADAVALLPVPMVAANLWQSFAGGHFVPTLRRFWPLVLAMVAGTVAGANVLAGLDRSTLNLVVGTIVVLFCLNGFVHPTLRLAPRAERGAGVVAGAVGGFMGGLSALFGPPIIVYFASLGLDRETFVGTISSIYLCCAVTLVVVFGSVGVMSGGQFVESIVACAPLLLGVWAGQWLRGRIREAVFRKVLLVVLLAVGARLIVTALV